MNFETFLFILKKNFNVIIDKHENVAKVNYRYRTFIFTHKHDFMLTYTHSYSPRVTCDKIIWDLSPEYCNEISIVDCFISILKYNNISIKGIINEKI